MTMSDPLADMLTRIRNGQQAQLPSVSMPSSKARRSVLEVLQREGYIRGFEVEEGPKPTLTVQLKYLDGARAAIREIHRVSRPGRRRYSNVANLPKYYNGLGVYVVSTSQGVMADHEARHRKVGGELLCSVF